MSLKQVSYFLSDHNIDNKLYDYHISITDKNGSRLELSIVNNKFHLDGNLHICTGVHYKIIQYDNYYYNIDEVLSALQSQ